jgi:hypothetical protein
LQHRGTVVMRLAIGNWPNSCNWLIYKHLLGSAIATKGSLVAITKQCLCKHGRARARPAYRHCGMNGLHILAEFRRCGCDTMRRDTIRGLP